MQDTKTPMKIGVMAMIVNVFLAALLMFWLQEGGLALANTLSSTMNAIALMTALRGRIGALEGQSLASSGVRTLVATSAMGLACWLAWAWLAQNTAVGAGVGRVLVLIPIAVGMIVFGVASAMLRAPELQEVSGVIRKRRKATGPGAPV
jgi:putative peptidoglycan lipid II flippase